VSGEAMSADVCYRHPNRESWTLCSRCGRTICPECQILTPSGVRCPDCVRETGGSVQWKSAGEPKRPTAPPRAARPRRQSARSESASPVAQRFGEMFRPGGETPVLTWGTLAIVVVLFIAGFVTSNLPFAFLFADQTVALQVWRYVTAPFTYPSVPQMILSILLNGLFFAITAPAVEKNLGRGRFAIAFAASSVVGNAAMVIAGFPGYGLISVLFGMFGAYLIFVWQYPPARAQLLIIIAINLLISLAFGARSLPALIGGLIAGAGATYLMQRYEGRNARTGYAIIAAVAAGFVVFALIRSLAF
jgi:membrane associated rhomboid family serine protease